MPWKNNRIVVVLPILMQRTCVNNINLAVDQSNKIHLYLYICMYVRNVRMYVYLPLLQNMNKFWKRIIKTLPTTFISTDVSILNSIIVYRKTNSCFKRMISVAVAVVVSVAVGNIKQPKWEVIFKSIVWFCFQHNMIKKKESRSEVFKPFRLNFCVKN